MKRYRISIFFIAFMCFESYTIAQTKYSAHIVQPDPMETPSICMVMIDPETEKNMIIWENSSDTQISQYQVWKKAGTGWNLISEINESDTSTMTDLSSQPSNQPEAYCLTTIDSCGNSTIKSPWHKPFFLKVLKGENNNEVILDWEPYQVNSVDYIFKSIVIYRGTEPNKLIAIDTVEQGIGTHSYTDTNRPLDENVYYRIGGEKEVACDPNHINGKKASSGPFVHSLSNLEDNRLQASNVERGFSAGNIKIYPNPLMTETKITWNNKDGENFDLIVYDLKGTRIKTIPGLSGKEYTLQRDDMKSGCYILELKGSKIYHIRLLVN